MKKSLTLTLAVVLIGITFGCARYEDEIQTEILPEPELYNLAMSKFNAQDWDAAIATFDRYERLYVDNTRVQEIRLKRADAQFNKNRTSSLILAKSEYQSFLALYPRYEREDYIWLQIAKCSYNQMLPPNREQAPTKEAIKDLELFLERFPDSDYVPEARELLQDAYINLGKHHIVVGNHYFGRAVFPAAAGRYDAALKMQIPLEHKEEIIYNYTVALARGSSYYTSMFYFFSLGNQKAMQKHFVELHEKFLFNAKQQLENYKSEWPGNTSRISTLQSEINLVTEIREEDKQKAYEEIEDTEVDQAELQ